MMCISFFWVRAVYYNWILFGPMTQNCIRDADTFWKSYEPWQLKLCYLSLVLFVVMYLLNMFWFYKIFRGTLKAFGCISSVKVDPKHQKSA